MLNKIWYKSDLRSTTDYDAVMSDSQDLRYVADFMHQSGLPYFSSYIGITSVKSNGVI